MRCPSALNIYPINKAYFAGCPRTLHFFLPQTAFSITWNTGCRDVWQYFLERISLFSFALYYLQSEVFHFLLGYFIFVFFFWHTLHRDLLSLITFRPLSRRNFGIIYYARQTFLNSHMLLVSHCLFVFVVCLFARRSHYA